MTFLLQLIGILIFSVGVIWPRPKRRNWLIRRFINKKRK